MARGGSEIEGFVTLTSFSRVGVFLTCFNFGGGWAGGWRESGVGGIVGGIVGDAIGCCGIGVGVGGTQKDDGPASVGQAFRQQQAMEATRRAMGRHPLGVGVGWTMCCHFASWGLSRLTLVFEGAQPYARKTSKMLVTSPKV